jgi:hypothetical protein
LYWGVVVVLVSYIVPVDKNAILDFLLDKRNELAKMINKDEITAEDDDLASESDIVEACLVPLVDCILAKITTMPTVPVIGRDPSIGYWTPTGGLKLKCSCCEKDSYGGKTPYCPNCGSLMGDRDDFLANLQ